MAKYLGEGTEPGASGASPMLLLFLWKTGSYLALVRGERDLWFLQSPHSAAELQVSCGVDRMRQRGFSLIELLIVVAIILIIAAIAVPNLIKARISANEASAVSSVRQIKTSEMLYANAYPTIGYAVQLSYLGGPEPCTPSSANACIVPDPLSSAGPGTQGKSGYVFSAVGSPSTGTLNDTFVVGAAPLTPNVTGTKLFCTSNDNALRADPGPGTTPVTTVAACMNYAPI